MIEHSSMAGFTIVSAQNNIFNHYLGRIQKRKNAWKNKLNAVIAITAFLAPVNTVIVVIALGALVAKYTIALIAMRE